MGAVVREATDEPVAVCECVLPESVLRCLDEGAAWSCNPEERSLALRFKAEDASCAFVTVCLPLPLAGGSLADALVGALAEVEVVALTTFLAGSTLSVSDSSGRFLVTIFDCEPVLTPPKKLRGSDPLAAGVGLTGLVAPAVVVAVGLGGCLIGFSARPDAVLGGLVPRGEGTLGFVSVSLRGLMLGRCVVEADLTGF